METQGPNTLCGAWLVRGPLSVSRRCLDEDAQKINLDRWSFGSDRLQVKAEIHILAEVESALQSGITIGSTPTGLQKSLQEKQDLLLLLLKNEQARLMVWLHPLEHNRKHHLLSSNHERITISSVRQLRVTP